MTATHEEVAPIDLDVHGLGTPELLRGAVAVVKNLLPEWRAGRPNDRRPEMALEAAEEWLAHPLPNLAARATLIAKECTKARAASLGYQHRIAEAARAIAQIPSSQDDAAARSLGIEALAKAEEHILAQYAVAAIYGKEQEVRHGTMSILREVAHSSIGGSPK